MRTITILFLVFLLGCQINEIHIDNDDPLKSVPVTDFGANGFDYVDDSQAFIDALANNGKVTVDTGKYIINNTVTLEDYNKLVGDGMADRYNRDIKGTSIVAGTTVKKMFQIEGFGNEMSEMLFTGHWGLSPYGDSLQEIITVGFAGGKNKFTKLAFRDVPADYICISLPKMSNTNYIEQCYFMGGEWGVHTNGPQYGLTIKECTFFQVQNGVFLYRSTEGFFMSDCFFDQIAGPSVFIDSSTWWPYTFQNIYVEWAWPFIETGTAASPVISIDGLFGVGDENVYLIELHCDARITIRNVVLYGFTGWADGQDFPILNYDTYHENIKLENVKIMKYQSSRDYKFWNKDFGE